MKKLLVLAALSAMAMGAKAEYASVKSIEIFRNFYESTLSDESFLNYGNMYLLTRSDYEVWSNDSKTLSDLQSKAFISAISTPYPDKDWGGYSFSASWANGESTLGEVSVNQTEAGGTVAVIPDPFGNKGAIKGEATPPYKPSDYPYEIIFAGETDWYATEALGDISGETFISAITDSGRGMDHGVFNASEAVPEPTSGLLLLLGVAGLALKRKRA